MLDFGDQVVTVVNQSKSVPGAHVFLPSCLCVLRFCGGLKAFGREGEYVDVVVFFFFAFVFIEL